MYHLTTSKFICVMVILAFFRASHANVSWEVLNESTIIECEAGATCDDISFNVPGRYTHRFYSRVKAPIPVAPAGTGRSNFRRGKLSWDIKLKLSGPVSSRRAVEVSTNLEGVLHSERNSVGAQVGGIASVISNVKVNGRILLDVDKIFQVERPTTSANLPISEAKAKRLMLSGGDELLLTGSLDAGSHAFHSNFGTGRTDPRGSSLADFSSDGALFLQSTIVPPVSATWRGSEGIWSQPNWEFSPDPFMQVDFPNNNSTDVFDVDISSDGTTRFTVTLQENIEIDSLEVGDELKIESGTLFVGGDVTQAGTVQSKIFIEGPDSILEVGGQYGLFLFSNLSVFDGATLSVGEDFNISPGFVSIRGANSAVEVSGHYVINLGGTVVEDGAMLRVDTSVDAELALIEVKGPESKLEVGLTFFLTGDPVFFEAARTRILDGGVLQADTIYIEDFATLFVDDASVIGKVLSSGYIEPGFNEDEEFAPATGIMNIEGSYTQVGPGALRIDISGTKFDFDEGVFEYDRLDVTGNANLKFGNIQVFITDNFVPKTTDHFDILVASNVRLEDGLVNLHLPPLPGCRKLVPSIVAVETGREVLRLNTLIKPELCDLNKDGEIDKSDITILLQDRKKSVEESSCGITCDLDADGMITVLDARRLALLCTQPSCRR